MAFRRVWAKETRHPETIVAEKCYLYIVERVFNSTRVHIVVGAVSRKIVSERKARECGLATLTFAENRPTMGMLNPMQHQMEARVGGRRDDTCGHGLSGRPLRIEPAAHAESLQHLPVRSLTRTPSKERLIWGPLGLSSPPPPSSSIANRAST